MSAAEPKGGDPRFDLSLLVAMHAALVPHVAALEAAGDPSLDADLAPPTGPDHIHHHEGCDCADCRAFIAEIDAVVDECRAQAITLQTDRALLGLDADLTLYPDPCPFALMARSSGGVAEGRARYARTPAAPAAPAATRPRFVPTAPARRAEVFA